MREKEVKVSIVVLVYNLEKYLPRCLDALVNQTLQEIEILCVDDGSTDGAPKIIDEYATRYPEKVKAFHKSNGGEYSTRNYGLERAIGEYITFIDTDDYVELNWAEILYQEAKKNDADIAVCGFERIDMNTNRVIGKDRIGNKYIVKNINPKDDFCAFINPAPWNKLYKREKVKQLRFLNLRCFSDMMFLASSFTKLEKIVIIPQILYHYNLRYDSQIHTINQEDIDNFKKYILEVKKLYIEKNKYQEMKNILELMVFIHLAISIMYRASYNKEINFKQERKETKEYLNEYFPRWQKNPFLKFSYCIKRGIKHIAIWLVAKMYQLNLEGIFFGLYRFMIDVLKIDIKW